MIRQQAILQVLKMKIITTKSEWLNALKNANYDCYHTWDYHQIAYNNGEGIPYLFIYTKGESKIGLPLLLRKINDVFFDFSSVYGYPGFISYGNSSSDIIDDFLSELKKWCFNNNIVSVFSRLNGLIFNTNLFDLIGETVFVDLTRELDLQWMSYRKNNRNLINKLKKNGYICSWDNSKESLVDFISIYNKTMDSLDASDIYYFNESYYQALMESKDFCVRIYNCYKDSVKVCAGLFVFCDDIVQYHLSGTVSEFKKDAPNRLMLDTVRIDATKEGYKYLHLGGGLGGQRDGLFDFKYSFSKETIDFQILTIITNIDEYLKLSNISLTEFKNNSSSFFPLYRKKD